MDPTTRNLLQRGREHYERREYAEAERCLREVLQRAEDLRYADVHNMLGVILHDRGAFEEARAHFEEALQINPHYTEAALNLAVTLNDLGDYEDARRIYKAAIEHGTDSPDHVDPFVKGKIANLHAEVAAAYADAGLLTEAIEELSKAVHLRPEFSDLRVRLANLYRRRGDLEAARVELERAVEYRPEYAPARVALGVVRLELGDARGAERAWEQALRVDPEERSAKMYLRMVRTGLTEPTATGQQAPAEGADGTDEED